ncbi:MAG: metallophosphoesterase, partial [Bacteroidota bacterium]
MRRRNFIKRALWSAVGTSVLTGLYTWQVEPFWLEFVERKMPVANLPDQLIGKTLMQISDIHVGNRFDYHYIIESFKKAQKYAPDFVGYTGDYISYENEAQFEQLNEVLQYVVKGRLGTMGILGNHDYGKHWTQLEVADKVAEQLEKAGITLLSNQQKEVSDLNFIGLDDYWGLNFSPEKVLKTYENTRANIVLCHNPDVCDLDVWHGYRGWILAGHTHGGQCKPPFLTPPMLPVKNKKYSAGEIA